jgi:PAS domain S-box-containing protein
VPQCNSELRRFHDDATVETVRTVGAGVALIFCAFLVYNVVDFPREAVLAIALHDVAVIALAASIRLTPAARITPRWAQPLTAFLGLAVVSNVFHAMWVLRDIHYTAYVLLVLVGVGCTLLSLRWTLATIVVTTCVWALVALRCVGAEGLVHPGFSVFAAVGLTLAVQLARLRAHRRMAELRLTDVRRKRQLESALEAAEQEIAERARAELRFAQLVDDVETVVWESDARLTRFHVVSRHAEEVLGYPADHWGAQPGLFLSRIHPEDRQRTVAVLAAAQARTGRYELECRVERSDGRYAWLRVLMHPLITEDGERRLRGVMIDRSEHEAHEERRRKLERQLMDASRLEALGKLAGGVAHDFNNLLAAILGHTELLLLEPDLDPTVREGAEVIQSAAKKGSALTEQLLGFARQSSIACESVDLETVAEEVIALLVRTLDKRIELCRQYEAPGVRVRADAQRLGQVLLNLAVNARDAMPDGGTLTVGTRVVTHDPEACRERPELMPGRYAQLSVQDTGVGIGQDVLPRVFEPFFTTKPSGKGTGMGLASSYGIVRSHGGFFTVDSTPGAGTTFTVHLLVAEASRQLVQDERAPSGGHERIRTGSGRVLLVDDEDAVRRVGAKVLENLGYEVLTACDGEEAQRVFIESKGELDLVILDMVMPRVDGRACLRALRRIDPEVRAIICTGYAESEAVADVLADGVWGVVQKPYSVAELSDAVAAALA